MGSDGAADQCALVDRLFSCDPTEETDPTARDMGFDADIVFRTLQSGEFIGDNNLNLRADVELNCNGNDCGILALFLGNFPCALVLDMDLAPSP